MNHLILILGGARSGKSRFAIDLASKRGAARVYLATGQAGDAEMARRIDRHRRERPSGWKTVEEPLRLIEALGSLEGKTDVVLVDCLTFWLSNLLMKHGENEEKALEEIDRLVSSVTKIDLPIVMVSNEVGLGIIPADPLTRLYRDLAGLLHQRMADVAHEVYWMVAGIATKIKGNSSGKVAELS